MGLPDKTKLAKEICQTMGCVLSAAIYYDVERELKAEIETCYQRLVDEGWIELST
jgi:hypothetical protein